MACIAAACGNGLHVRDSSGYAGTVTGYDTFDPMNYYDVWNGDTSIAPLVPARSVTKEEWTALVRKDRDQGLRLLSQDERLLLFQGALKAFFISVRGTKRSIVAPEGTSDVIEQYSRVKGLYLQIDSREQPISPVTSAWTDLLWSDDNPSARREFKRSADSVDAWVQNPDGGWVCKSYGGIASGEAIAVLGLLQNMLTVLADHIVREGTYSGRRAVLFATNSQYGTLGEWIDEKSLLPLGFVLPEIRVAGQPEFEPILAREVQITALNPEDTIVKPDGVCTEG